MNADGTNETRIANHPAQDTDPVFNHDGSRIVFLTVRDGDKSDLCDER